MLDVPAGVWEALGDSHVRRRMFGIAQYQDRQATLNVTSDGDVSFSASKGVQSDASVTVVGTDASLVPRLPTDMLAPYGQEVALFWEIRLRGNTTHLIPMGVFRIAGNDGGRETINSRSGVSYVTGWAVSLDLADRFHMLERGKLIDPKSPVSASMWDELQRVSLFPLLQSLPDAAVPPAMAYGDRLDVVWDLAALGGGIPALTRQGALTLRQADRWLTETVPDFTISGAIEFKREQTDEFYNYVWAHSDDNRFSAFAALENDGDPRSVNRAGPVTYEHSSPVYESDLQAKAGADAILERLLNRRSQTVRATVGPQALLLELGDFGWIEDPVQGRSALGEITSISVSNDPTAPIDIQMIVAEET